MSRESVQPYTAKVCLRSPSCIIRKAQTVPFKIIKKSNLQQQCLGKTKKARKINADKVATTAAINMTQNDLAPDLVIEWRSLDELEAPKRRVRKIVPDHVNRAIKSITTFGMISPITVRGTVVVDGHTRLAAARELGMSQVPCIDVGHLSEASARMLAISLNRLAELGEWDMDELKLELTELEIEDIDLEVSFFSAQELDIILSDGGDSEPDGSQNVADPEAPVTTVEGDLWLLGERHRVLCGNSLEVASFKTLLGDSVAHAVLTDVPYNVKIAGNVSGLGSPKVLSAGA
jgi:hypothetical protein